MSIRSHIIGGLALSLASLLAQGTASAEADSSLVLTRRFAALQIEHDLMSRRPRDVYLVIDAPAGVILLKLNGRLLRTMPIRKQDLRDGPGEPTLLVLNTKIAPASPEPGAEASRLRGRALPLDFRTRLLEGPRDRTRFYFTPSFLVGPEELPASITAVRLAAPDIRALASALEIGIEAVFIPPHVHRAASQ